MMRYLVIAGIAVAMLTGCREERATESATEAGRAIGEGAREVAAVTESAVEGFFRGWREGETLNINSSSREDLERAGFSREQADRVIAGRPYRSPDELVSRGILSEEAYSRTQNRWTVGEGGGE